MTRAQPIRRLLASVSALGLLAALSAGVAIAADQSVTIAGFAYDPATVMVNVGDSVTWTNNDDVPHTATADNGSFDTGSIAAGGSDSVTFGTAGTFEYHCSFHPNMTGSVVVEAAGGGGGGGGGGGTPTQPNTDAISPEGVATGQPAAPLAGLLVAAALGALVSVRLFRRATR